jgi:hypothetical protein
VIEKIGAGEGNRTLVISLEGCCSTIELHPHRGPAARIKASDTPDFCPSHPEPCPLGAVRWWGR